MDEDQKYIGQDSSYVYSPIGSSLETSDMCSSDVNSRLLHQKCHKQPSLESSPTQTTTKGFQKVKVNTSIGQFLHY